MTGMKIQCPRCPLCGGPPAPWFDSPVQAFCDNPDCSAICWNPSRTLDENILDSKAHRLPGWLRGN